LLKTDKVHLVVEVGGRDQEEMTVVRSDGKTTWNKFKLSAERNKKHSQLLFGKFNPKAMGMNGK
jgi:hypothetical protein